MLKKFIRFFGGDPNKREIEKGQSLVERINTLEAEFEALSDEGLAAKTTEFRARLAEGLEGVEDESERNRVEGDILDELLPEAFAVVREASKRTIGLRHYDVQLIGGASLHQGKIAEMRTGEGKTLVATLPVYLNALTGRGVHLITVNDYLARRDARWMAPIYKALGLSVGVLQMAARTENGKKAFLVDLEHTSPHEDQHQLLMVPRVEAYAADITYGTNSEFGFDYLRDNMTNSLQDRVQRGHYYAIIDEVDNVLIDEARTPLIISGPAQDEAEWYMRVAQVVKALRTDDYEVNEKDKTVTLTEIGEAHVEELLNMPLRDPDRPEDVNLEQARILGYLEQGLRAQFLFKRNKDYLVQGGKVIIIDEFTGRLMPGRRWSDGLHQAVEAKEGVKVENESVTYATITIQNYFRMYQKLAGMSGTALTEAEEFDKIYKLGVLPIPTNLEYQALKQGSILEEVEARDEHGYKYVYYANKGDTQRTPVFWKRKDYPDIVYRTEEAKLRAIATEILKYHVIGRPLLVGTTSVDLSEMVSGRLRAEPIRRLMLVQLLRQAWLEKNKMEDDGRLIEKLKFLNDSLDKLDISEMRKLSRELDLSFNPEDPSNLQRLIKVLDLSSNDIPRLQTVLQAGIPHQVLNARKHTEESQIIAGAGAFGAVTIATNMAGRGVDIKLGGEMREEVTSAVNRVLSRAGIEDPYDMPLDDRYKTLKSLDTEQIGIYETEVQEFFQHVENMDLVRRLGGLHVIGSERHEARRIDNQLRGRAARQGDPGSSRFYLSMEDELMRLFGGQQADGLMQRLKIDDAVPLEAGLVSRIVEQAQSRVEGANFDVRKHLLEYDDVLNTQRAKIYAQRNRIFTKEDLSDDVSDMLRTEVNRRVPEALKDTEGPWKLLAWLDQIQPPISYRGHVYPSYSLSLIIDEIEEKYSFPIDAGKAIEAITDIARQSLLTEKEHVLNTVSHLIGQAEERLESQLSERLDALDTFFEGLSLEDETDTRRPAELQAELSNLLHLSLKLTNEQQRALRSQPKTIAADLRNAVENALTIQAYARVIGSIERRLEEGIEITSLQGVDNWNDLSALIEERIHNLYEKRLDRYLGSGGQISREIESVLEKFQGAIQKELLLQLLMYIPQGSRATFDKKTHKRVFYRTTRLTYVYYAAHHLENRDPDDITANVLEHLEKAQEVMNVVWGLSEFGRLYQFDLVSAENMPKDLDDPRIVEVGKRVLTEIYRQLLLRVIGELWIDYLTQMEALRISIGLEAYAQRDPLVQYKNRAFGLFQELLSNMRLGLVSRMFTYQPKDSPPPASGAQTPSKHQMRPPEAILSVENAAPAEATNSDSEPAEGPDMEGQGTSDVVQMSDIFAGAGKEETSGSTDGKKRRRRRR